MRSLKLQLTIPDTETLDGKFQVSADGGRAGQISSYTTRFPFGDPSHRQTILKALGAVEFRDQDFKSEELDWMVEVGLVTQERDDFGHDLQTIIGREIYKSLFPTGEPRELLGRAIAQTGSQEQLHVQIGFSKDRRGYLPDYPWELAHDGDRFLARGKIVFSRFIAFLENTPDLPPVEPINVLLVSSTASDRDLGLTPLSSSESDAIDEVLTAIAREGDSEPTIRLHRLKSPTFKAFCDYLIENRQETAPHIIHFDGHGFFGKRCDNCRTMHAKTSDRACRRCGKSLQDKIFQGYLLFQPDEDCKQNADYVSAREIAVQLQKVGLEQSSAHGLRLAVLSACKTGMALGGDSVFNGVAQSLMQSEVPAAIAMQYNVTTDAAKAFSERFYRAIRQQCSIAHALGLGQAAMREGNQWYRPVLYLRWYDNEGGQLFARTEPVSGSSSNDRRSDRKLSRSQQLQKDSLVAELEARHKDYEGVNRKYRREQNPAAKNSFKDQLDELLEDIERIEGELDRFS